MTIDYITEPNGTDYDRAGARERLIKDFAIGDTSFRALDDVSLRFIAAMVAIMGRRAAVSTGDPAGPARQPQQELPPRRTG